MNPNKHCEVLVSCSDRELGNLIELIKFEALWGTLGNLKKLGMKLNCQATGTGTWDGKWEWEIGIEIESTPSPRS